MTASHNLKEAREDAVTTALQMGLPRGKDPAPALRLVKNALVTGDVVAAFAAQTPLMTMLNPAIAPNVNLILVIMSPFKQS